VYHVISLQSHGRCRWRRQHSYVDGPRVHFCSAGIIRMTQHVEARAQRPGEFDDIHLCNRLNIPSCIAHPMHATVALPVRRMCGSVFAPIVGVACAPSRLGTGLVVAIVAVDTEPVVLPVASTSAMASFRRAVTLTRDMQQRHERVATGETEARRFHGCPPNRVCDGQTPTPRPVAETAGRRRNREGFNSVVASLNSHRCLSGALVGQFQKLGHFLTADVHRVVRSRGPDGRWENVTRKVPVVMPVQYRGKKSHAMIPQISSDASHGPQRLV